MEKKMDDARMQEHWKMHRKMIGCKLLVLGALVFANSYWDIVTWPTFIAIVLVLGGIMKLTGCCHSKCCK